MLVQIQLKLMVRGLSWMILLDEFIYLIISMTSANIAAVRQHIQLVSELMRQSGVGALPLLFSDADGNPPSVPDENKMLEEANQAVKILYEKLETNQQSAATVANLLGANPASNSSRA
jgi:hypothetical protein